MQPISAGSSSIVELMAMLQQLYHPESSSTASSSSSTASSTSSTSTVSTTDQNAGTATAVENSIAASGYLSSTALASGSLMALLESQSFDDASTTSITGSFSDATFDKWISTADSNHDGLISKTEFEAAVPSNVTTAQADALFASIDTAGTGTVTAAQLRAGLQSAVAAGPTAATPTGGTDRLFEALDTNGDGTVTEAEFEADAAGKLTQAQADAVFADLDIDGNGSLSATEFGFALGTQSAPVDANGDTVTSPFAASQTRALEILSSLPSSTTFDSGISGLLDTLGANGSSATSIQNSNDSLASLLGITTTG
jgi:Ca2+-binding EF-hand superfamily protein